MEENTPLPKKKRPATKLEIEKDLKLIYKNDDDDDDPNDHQIIKRAERKRRWPKITIAALALLLLAGVTWFGIMRFGGSVRYGNNVDIAIEGPSAPRAGEVETWTIRYKNNENIPLAQSALTVNLPNSITIISSEPQLLDMNTRSPLWNIGSIAPATGGDIVIRGRVLDAVDAPIAIGASLSYRPANFNSDFTKVSPPWSSRIADAAVTGTLTAPEEAVPGDDQTFTLKVERRGGLSSEAVIPGLKIRFDPDQLVIAKSADPAFSANDARTWIAAAPSDDKPLTFTVIGGFAANASGNANLRADIGTLDANGNFILLSSATAVVNILPGDLVLTLIRNGSNADSTAALGSSMHISVDYENKSQKPINDAEISLTVAGSPSFDGMNTVDWGTLDDIRGGKRNNDTITWTKKEIPELATIAPNGKGSVDISFKTVSSVFTTNDRNYNIDLSARGLIGSFDNKKSGKSVSTPVIRTLLTSDARISAAAGLIDGALKAGSNATYRVVWVLTNSLHEISAIKVTAKLPPKASFVAGGQVTAGEPIYYDGSTNTVTWTLNRLPTSIKSVSVDFTISVSPNDNDIGKTVELLEDTELTATDKDINTSIAYEAAPLNTTDADITGGSGLVQP